MPILRTDTFPDTFPDPNLHRFINRDPIQELGGLNLYGFVGNNPLGRVDLWGLDEDDFVELPDLKKKCPTADSGVPNWKSDLSHDTHQFINETGKEMARNAACSAAGWGVGKALGALGRKAGCIWKECKGLFKKAPKLGRTLDDILKDRDLFKRWLKSSHNPNMPLSPSDAKKVWDEMQKMGMKPILDPGHPSGVWTGRHINVRGTTIHIPVDPGFTI